MAGRPVTPRRTTIPPSIPWRWRVTTSRPGTNPGDLVLDPMAGSGTTLRAARDAGRESIGIEVHEPYYRVDTAASAATGTNLVPKLRISEQQGGQHGRK